jgi:hypothetical protein
MTIPAGFLFSQGNLQDFADCQRRFQLRYILKVAWPAIESEPVLENERYMQLGQRFHRMVHQHLLGVPAEMLTRQVQDEGLAHWWENYLQFAGDARGWLRPENEGASPVRRYPEHGLSATLDGHRLVAQYDLIVVTPDERMIIFDWKTARKRPRRAWLEARLQTRLYPYLLVRAGMQLNAGKPIAPENVEMLYWFAGFPEQPERFEYSLRAFQKDESYLKRFFQTLQRLGNQEFEKTSDEKRCAFCTYRSLCERGVGAGWVDETEMLGEMELEALDVDFEQIAEIEY